LIDSGTSGGAAFDADGNYIGVPTAAVSGDIGGSLGYLIGADIVDKFLIDYFANVNLLSEDGQE
jgi:S1-C subfamily serine protease